MLSKLENLVLKSSFKCGAVFNLDNAAQPLERVRSICVFQLLKHTKISRCSSFGNIENRNVTVTLLLSFSLLNTSQWRRRAGMQTLVDTRVNPDVSHSGLERCGSECC